ncbi:hypothetical protein F4801DRAFT_582844 [Xylaria longipes]|nr:hypothetical protein F4801DRAFT_582844 [Xylaria longipes]
MRVGDWNFSSGPIQTHFHYQDDPEFSNHYCDQIWPEDIGLSDSLFEGVIVTNDPNFIVGQTTTTGLHSPPISPTLAGRGRHGSGYVVRGLAGNQSINLNVFGFNHAYSPYTGGWMDDNTYNPFPDPPVAIPEDWLSQPLPLSAPLEQPSGTTGPPREHTCTKCFETFTHKKDMVRHMNTVHATGDEEVYRCRCSKVNVRKDNYLRHVSSCNGRYHYPNYICKCLSVCDEKEEHIDHVKNCRHGFGRAGRPSPTRT